MLGFSWAEIGWFLLTGLLGVVMWATQVEPKQVKSNLSKWVQALGWANPPDVVRRPQFDKWFRYGSLVIWLVVSAALAIWIFYPRGESQLETYRFQGKPPKGGEQFFINVHLANRGTLKAYSLQFAGGLGVTNDAITEQFAARHFQIAYSTVIRTPESVGNEIPPGSADKWFTVWGPQLTDKIVGELTSGRALPYLIMVIRYKDANVPTNQWRYTEACVYFQNNGASHLCDFGRNRTYTGP